jgi:hypothetical protein
LPEFTELDNGRARLESDMSIEAFKSAVEPLLAELEASANAHDTDRHLA